MVVDVRIIILRILPYCDSGTVPWRIIQLTGMPLSKLVKEQFEAFPSRYIKTPAAIETV